MEFGEKGDWAFVHDYDRNRRWVRTFQINLDTPGQEPKLVWERSVRDRYGDAGRPVLRLTANNQRVIVENGDSIYLDGEGASPKGDYPFLDRYSLSSHTSERIFHAADKTYEQFVALLNDDGSRFITRFENPNDPPNLYLREAGKSDAKTALTHFPDPAPQLRGITKQLVTYKRDDGVQLSFTLYLPADYKTRRAAADDCLGLSAGVQRRRHRGPGIGLAIPVYCHQRNLASLSADSGIRDPRQRNHAGDRRSGNHEQHLRGADGCQRQGRHRQGNRNGRDRSQPRWRWRTQLWRIYDRQPAGPLQSV